MTSSSSRKLRVAFLHPDLGIGGAERLVVDAALGLQNRGHQVSIYTSHHDPSHCFRETKDGTLKIRVHGSFLPRTIFGSLHIIMAIIRNALCSLKLVIDHYTGKEGWDVIVVDQLSSSIPLLHLSNSKILFYMHFPDLLLAQRPNLLKKLYRLPIDLLEEITTGVSDRILVNSRFTANTFEDTFPRLASLPRLAPHILYPAINFSSYDEDYLNNSDPQIQQEIKEIITLPQNTILLVSINRFERKKNIQLAIQCLAFLYNLITDKTTKNRLKLVLSGGYDPRVKIYICIFEEICVYICIYVYMYELEYLSTYFLSFLFCFVYVSVSHVFMFLWIWYMVYR